MKIICIGHASYDITFPMDNFPIENTKNRVNKRIECGGGPASNAAYLLGKWGEQATFLGVVGNDEYGEVIKQEFEEVGVNTNFLEVNNNVVTTSSIIIANKQNGSRTVLTYRPDSIKMKPVKLNFYPEIILTDGQEIDETNRLFNKYSNAIRIIDASRPTKEIIELSKLCHFIICSYNFALTVTGLEKNNTNEHYQQLMHRMKEIFQGRVIITLEENGCLYETDGGLKRMPSIKIKAVDTTAAGDIFHGAFTYGLAKGYNLEQTLKIATIAGALSVTKIGGRYSVPELEEVLNYGKSK